MQKLFYHYAKIIQFLGKSYRSRTCFKNLKKLLLTTPCDPSLQNREGVVTTPRIDAYAVLPR